MHSRLRHDQEEWPEVYFVHSLFWLGIRAFLIALVLVQLLVQVLLNIWNRNFFDALERKDGHALWLQAQLFVPLAAASILLAATSVWAA